MADGRMLRKKISVSKQVSQLIRLVDSRISPPHGAFAAIVFTWGISHLDCEGRMNGDPMIVRAKVCPLISEISEDNLSIYLSAMAELGMIQWYEAKGDKWIHYPGFDRSQVGLRKSREAGSECPSPHGSKPVITGTLGHSGVTPEQLPRPCPGSEVKGSEVKLSCPASGTPSSSGNGQCKLADVPVQTPTSKQKAKRTEQPPLPFQPEEAVDLVARAAGKRFIRPAGLLEAGHKICLNKLIREFSDAQTWRTFGEWLAAGGGWNRPAIDIAWLCGNFKRQLNGALEWQRMGRQPVQATGRIADKPRLNESTRAPIPDAAANIADIHRTIAKLAAAAKVPE